MNKRYIFIMLTSENFAFKNKQCLSFTLIIVFLWLTPMHQYFKPSRLLKISLSRGLDSVIHFTTYLTINQQDYSTTL